MPPGSDRCRLFLCGDVMLGRGIDQILKHSSDPRLEEEVVRDARDYVQLAEEANGRIPRAVAPSYVWGDALEVLNEAKPDARIINLETSITTSEARWPGKEVHYRMHPGNVDVLTAAQIDVAVLSNNHLLDHGVAGLLETLDVLHAAGIRTTGAGRRLSEAESPAEVQLFDGRVRVWGFGSTTSGVPPDWAATPLVPGISVVSERSTRVVEQLRERIARTRQPGDQVVASIHWGGNWGYDVPPAQVGLAHALIDAGVDLVHGHSSHHPRPIEVYRERLVLYGCGDFLNDYEGIRGYEVYRGDLVLMYLPELSLRTGELVSLKMVPLRIFRFRLQRASRDEAAWLQQVLDRESRRFGVRIRLCDDGALALHR